MISYIIWNVNPDVFTIPFLNHPVRWYGLFWGVGLVLGQLIISYVYKKEARPGSEVDSLTLYLFVGTLLGARLGHVLFYDASHYFNNPLKILAFWEGGLASHGAGVGIFIATYLYARSTKLDYFWILDRLVIATAVTGACIRLGNLMNSEMVGLPTSLPWAFVFVSIDDQPRHPAQLYEAIFCFFLFVASFVIWKRYRSQMKNGFLLGWFLIILFSFRFVDEFFKINQVAFENDLMLNMGQWLSIPFILAGIGVLFISNRNHQANTNSQ